MNKLFELGNQYVKESDWKDLALVKFCLCAMGIIIGTRVSSIGNVINLFFMTFPAPIFAACKRRIFLAKIVRIPRRVIVNGKYICRLL